MLVDSWELLRRRESGCYVVMWPGCDVASDSIKSRTEDRLPVRRRRMEGGPTNNMLLKARQLFH
eukprot:scaffold4059_cov193-Skeletonema_marinoi.AAC.1